MKTKKAQIPYPEDLPANQGKTPEEFENELRYLAAARLYELGRISSGRAAEMAGVSRRKFLNNLSDYKVSPLNYSAKELEDEIAAAQKRAAQKKSS